MHSLRLRIAVWYTLLLVVAIVALGIALTFRLENILRAQAEQHLNVTIADMAHAVAPPQGSFLFSDPTALLALENPDNLERWSSVNTFIEVDDLRGYTVAKSFNMGSLPTFGDNGVVPGRTQTLREAVVGGRRFLVKSALLASGNIALIVQVGEPLDALQQAFSQAQSSMIFILIVAALAVGGLSFFLASEVTSPLNQLTAAMREIGSEGLDRRLHWQGRQDEVGALAQAFDDLLARLQEAFARERRFIADASHELKTPLTSINANAQMLARWGDRDETLRKESLQTIADESAALAGMINGMLTLAKAESGEQIPKEALSLGSAVRDALAALQTRIEEKGLSLLVEIEEPAPRIFADASLIRQLVTNLVDNAVKFTAAGTISVGVSGLAGKAVLEVRDTGAGIAQSDIPLIFDRFYRADPARTRTVPGTGLGLAIVRSIARVHDATIDVQSEPGRGTTFRVAFPCVH